MNLQKLRPQSKIVQVNDKVGNNFVKNEQGTTKTIYDQKRLAPNPQQQVIDLFRDSRNRDFPETNFDQQLIAGDTLALQRMALSVIEESTEDGSIVAVRSLQDFLTIDPALALAEMSIEISNKTVMKPIAIQQFLPEYNKNAYNETSCILEFLTDLILIPQVDFKVSFRIPPLTFTDPVSGIYKLRSTIEGVGGQLNLDTNF